MKLMLYGKRIKQIKVEPGQSGQKFKTTLDLEIQKLATAAIKDTAASAQCYGYI